MTFTGHSTEDAATDFRIIRFCCTCEYYEIIVTADRDSGKDAIGNCHRYPPRIMSGEEQDTLAKEGMVDSYFPMVHEFEWCGEYRFNGEKR